MKRKVAIIHVTQLAVQPMLDAFKASAPDMEIINLLDEGLLVAVNELGGVTPPILNTFKGLLQKGIDCGADGILLSCSAFSPYVEELEAELPVPLVSVDGAMLKQAIALGERIGIVATVVAAGHTTERFLQEIAAKRGKRVTTRVEIVTEAFDELKRECGERHDELVRQAAEKLLPVSDVLVLAQLSMARAADSLVFSPIPVLTSPLASVKALMERI
ncbi:MAG: Asp/Glu/hydantoin racemase [Paenibacillaceae bacterium]|jgi:Asp/Glu/hydantoin racemase|nr:Asp/Glu/hydantoin racemase [Paenibacillaceae bacterium]